MAVAIALLLRAFVVEAFQIPSGSMIPTLEIGDHIFVSKFSYGLGIPFTDTSRSFSYGQPKRGDVIVFKFPLDPTWTTSSGWSACPGEQVEVRKNEIFINGRPMPRELVREPCSYEDGPPLDGACGASASASAGWRTWSGTHARHHPRTPHGRHRLAAAWWCRPATSS